MRIEIECVCITSEVCNQPNGIDDQGSIAKDSTNIEVADQRVIANHM
jgi:hypothetical protein